MGSKNYKQISKKILKGEKLTCAICNSCLGQVFSDRLRKYMVLDGITQPNCAHKRKVELVRTIVGHSICSESEAAWDFKIRIACNFWCYRVVRYNVSRVFQSHRP